MSVRSSIERAKFAVLAFTIYLGGCATVGKEAPSWIDTHLHLIGRPHSPEDFVEAVGAAIPGMDGTGITKSVAVPPPRVTRSFDCEQFLDAIRKHRERFAFACGGGTLNPLLHGAEADEPGDRRRANFEARANEIVRLGAAGFGEIAIHHYSYRPGHPYESVPADHPLLLLLMDIAARHGLPIDLHFDPVVRDTVTPAWLLPSPPNPMELRANVAALERLLTHNRSAKIVWAHAADPLGHWTAALSRELLERHPNLYISIRIGAPIIPAPAFRPGGSIDPEWMMLFRDFPDRFVMGTDQFIVSRQVPDTVPAVTFARNASVLRRGAREFLSRLPAELARRIGYENAVRLYRLTH
jgi:predicted TIM-barrel fold metal-dependent hydrolase